MLPLFVFPMFLVCFFKKSIYSFPKHIDFFLENKKQAMLTVKDFHRIGPLGQFSLVVAMSVHLCLCLCICPLPMRFLKCGSQKGLDVECGYLLILINSGERYYQLCNNLSIGSFN